MRDLAADVHAIVVAVVAVDLESASAEVRERLAVNTASDLVPCGFEASHAEMVTASEHEAAHTCFSYSIGDTILSVSLRADGTGCCRTETRVGDRQSIQDRVTMLLCGVAANLKRDPTFIVKPSSDLIEARIRLAELNARDDGPPLSVEAAAQAACDFVREHWRAIQNVGLVLLASRELIHDDVRIFSSVQL
jgi:hypothetical protein